MLEETKDLKGYKWTAAPTEKVDALWFRMTKVVKAMNEIIGGEIVFLSDESSIDDFSHLIDDLDKLLAEKLGVEVKATDRFHQIAERLSDDSANN